MPTRPRKSPTVGTRVGGIGLPIGGVTVSTDATPPPPTPPSIVRPTIQVWQFVAYLAFEQRKYSEALEAVNNAIAAEVTKGGKKDPQLPRLKQAIEESIKDRDAQAEVLKAKQKL